MKPDKIVLRLRAFLAAKMRDAQQRLKRPGRDGRDKVVHDVRKTIKALRAGLRLAEKMAPARALNAVGKPLRAAAHALGPMRDHLVLRETAGRVVRRREEAPPEPVAPEAPPLLKRARTDLQKAAAALGRLLQEDFEAKGAKRGLRAIYKRARQAMAAAEKTSSDEALHAWRRRAKDLYYVVELIETPAGLRRKVKRLTQFLGDDHDLATFIAHHNSTAGSDAFGHLLKRAGKRRRPLQKKAFRVGEELFGGTAGDFVREVLR